MSDERFENKDESTCVLLINVSVVENNCVGVCDKALNVLDIVNVFSG